MVIEKSSKTAMGVTRIVYMLALSLVLLPFSIVFAFFSVKPSSIITDPGYRELFFSYAWGGEKEKIVDELFESLKGYKKIKLIRDRQDVGYGELNSDFMKRIGKGNLAVVVISDKYLRSPYYMFELYELYRNSNSDVNDLLKKLFPVKAESIDLSNPEELKMYFAYWDNEFLKWKQLVMDSNMEPSKYIRIGKIANSIRELLPFLSDINIKTVEIIRDNNFEEIRQKLEKRRLG